MNNPTPQLPVETPQPVPQHIVAHRQTIYKYPLPILSAFQTLLIAVDFIPLTLQKQNGIPTLWALVDPTAPQRQVGIYIVGTGDVTPAFPVDYLGTIQSDSFVWHYFLKR